MRYLLKLALANIMRAKRRTMLTILILSFGILFYIIMAGMLDSFIGLSIRNLIDFDTGDMKIRSSEYVENKPYKLSNFITGVEEVEHILNEKDYIIGFTERVNFLAEIDNFYEVLPIVVVGIDPVTDPSVFTLTNFFEQGSLESGGIIMGKSLADDMNISLNEEVYLTFRDIHGAISSREFLVSGFVNAADPMVNASMAFINIDEAQEYLRIDTVTEISVKTTDYQNAKEFTADLQQSLPGYAVHSWRYLGRDMIEFMKADSGSGYMFVVMILIIAVAGTANTMLLSIHEKRHEIGTLKALGMTDRDIKRLFVIEGAVMGFMGAVMGIVLGILVNLFFIYRGVNFSAFFGDEGVNIGYRVMGTIKSTWQVDSYLYAILMGIATTTVASIIPARKTVKMDPAECLRITR